MLYDPLIWAFILPGMLLGSYAQAKVQTSVRKFSSVPLQTGLTGAQVARHRVDVRGVQNVRVEPVKDVLSDHYDPRGKVLRLSGAVLGVRSVTAAGTAAHEAGHAIQDADDHAPMDFRTAIVSVVKAGTSIGPIVFLVGLFSGSPLITWIGAILFGASALLAPLTLQVEFDASRRALVLLENTGISRSPSDPDGAQRVLRAAARTYVAAAAVSALRVGYVPVFSRRG